ncbi:MAG: hypothetical protein MUE48_04520 [Desulfobacterales bacterium]|jgi:hypothetical protein|nr:hypothetical protein [Desulfobacterales bacterium]
MRTSISPVIATLLFAAAAAAVVASAAALPGPAPRVSRMNAALYLALAGYSVYLARLHRRATAELSGPLLVAAAAALGAESVPAFALPATAALSWVRWGIGSRPPRLLRAALELIAAAGALTAAAMFCRLASGPYAWAAAVWGFGLAQAAFLACLGAEAATPDRPAPVQLRTHALLREKKLERAFEELGL